MVGDRVRGETEGGMPKGLWVMLKISAFTINRVGSHWIVLSQGDKLIKLHSLKSVKPG